MSWRAALTLGLVLAAGYLAVHKFHYLSDPDADLIARAEPLVWGALALISAFNVVRALQGRRML